MKVGIIGPTYPLRGGQALLLGHVHEALVRRGVETSVVTFRKLYPRLLFPGKTERNESGSPVKPLDSHPILSPTAPLSWLRGVSALGAGGAPDVLLLTWWNPFFGPMFRAMCALARRRYGCRVVMICENVVSHEERAVDAMLTRIGLAAADAFIVLSDAVAETLAAFRPGAPLRHSSLPIYDCYLQDGGATTQEGGRDALAITEDRVILFFGLVRAYKGLDLLIDAVARGRHRLGSVRLLVVGEFYEGEEATRRQISEQGLEDCTTVVSEYVPDEAVGTYFGAADVVVLPYRSATQSGITQVALGLGTPMIATRVGGLPEVVQDGENGLLVPPEDPDQLADALVRFFDEDLGPVFRRKMGTTPVAVASEDEIAVHVCDLAGVSP